MTAKKSKAKAPKRGSKAKKGLAATATAPRVGVFDVIREQLASAKAPGRTVEDMHKALVKAHPDRAPEGMLKTLRIQLSRQGAKRTIIDGVRFYLAGGKK